MKLHLYQLSTYKVLQIITLFIKRSYQHGMFVLKSEKNQQIGSSRKPSTERTEGTRLEKEFREKNIYSRSREKKIRTRWRRGKKSENLKNHANKLH